jgi:ElaB/YqjD/DUF883 family membrane-anchored ribosome-binding protein
MQSPRITRLAARAIPLLNPSSSPLMKPSSRTSSGAQTVDELIANISQLMAEAEEMLSESPSSRSTVRELQRRWQGTGERLLAGYDTAKEKLAAVARNTDTMIRHYPYESVAMALGLGIGLGALLFRRRR